MASLEADEGMATPLSVRTTLGHRSNHCCRRSRPSPRAVDPRARSARLDRIIFVLQERHSLGDAAAGAGLWLGHDCWRRLRDWQAAGVWERLAPALLDRLGEAGQIDWSRESLDSASIPAKRGAIASERIRRMRQTGHEAPSCGRRSRNPAGRAPDWRQSPRLGRLRGTDRRIPPSTGERAAAAERPEKLHADKG